MKSEEQKYQDRFEYKDRKLVNQVIAKYPDKVANYKEGKEEVLDFFIKNVSKINRSGIAIEKIEEYIQDRLKSLSK